MKQTLRFVLTAFVIAPLSALALQGPGDPGGGDSCESRIQTIRDDIRSWIQDGGASQFKNIPVSAEQYAQQMLPHLMIVKQADGSVKPVTDIECINQPVEVQERQKLCRFDRFETSQRITCFRDAFAGNHQLSPDEQYRLIHHEYAGLARLEIPSASNSIYSYSDQLADHLENQVVKKLVIRKATKPGSEKSEFCISESRGGSWTSTCSNQPKEFSSYVNTRDQDERKRLSKAKLDKVMNYSGFEYVGGYYFDGIALHVKDPAAQYMKDPAAQYCILAQPVNQGVLSDKWFTLIPMFDCGDGSTIKLQKENVEKFLQKNGYELAYRHQKIVSVWDGDRSHGARVTVYKRNIR